MVKKAVESESKTVLLGRPGNNVSMGIVGLPNVGKSTLFNILTKLSVPAENFPFCTIQPTTAKVPVPDERFDFLVKSFRPKREVPAVLTITDIAGLVKGAAEGEGLGNEFLSNIQAADGIFHVVRAFSNAEVTHVEGSVDPIRDLEIIHGELRRKDLQRCEAMIETDAKKVERGVGGKEKKAEFECICRVRDSLTAGKDIRCVEWSTADIEILNKHQFLTAKPVVYLVNLGKKSYITKKNKHLNDIAEWVASHTGERIIPFSADFENELIEAGDNASKVEEESGAKSCISRIIRSGYHVLQLVHFFTVGEDEVRAWTIKRGTLAPKAAGVIHTDFEKGFICADVYALDDYKELGTESAVRAAGKLRMEGRKYEMRDGDIVHFKFN